jgi:hypothetical protein
MLVWQTVQTHSSRIASAIIPNSPALAEHEVEDVRVVSKDWVADTRTFIQVARSLQILNGTAFS